MTDHEFFMDVALEEAARAAREGEVPVGAAAVFGDEVIARDHNRREALQDPTAHAEILVLREAARRLGRWRLTGVRLYATMEPCALCAGGLALARIDTLIFGCRDPKAGACGSVFSIVQDLRLNHRIAVVEGVRAEECTGSLRAFFQDLRRQGSADAAPAAAVHGSQ
ncbi:MAG: nucleoside deaminase [Nitrospirae bacterium]|nr:nucleoside deaminase [Nitrospirota bacterium]